MNGKRLQVLYINSWYPNKLHPLLGVFVKRHAVAVSALAEVACLSVYADEQDSVEEVVEDGIYTIRVGYKRVKNVIPGISSILKLKKYNDAWLKAITLYEKNKGRPDIVNLNVPIRAGNVAIYIKRKWNVPYVLTEHWTGYFPEDGRYKGPLIKALTRRVVKNASAVITVSNDLKTQMLSLGLANDYTVISNVVDTNTFVLGKPSGDGKLRFIHVSSLDDTQKNVSGILRAFANFYKTSPDAELTIVGNGEDRTKLEALSTSLGISKSVHFVGAKIQNELVQLLQQSTAFVLFSNYETQAIVLLEALCCGIPVIATKAGGIGEYVHSGNGLLITRGDEAGLTEAMLTVASGNARFDFPEAIRASVVDKVNSGTIAKQFIDVYNKVLNKR